MFCVNRKIILFQTGVMGTTYHAFDPSNRKSYRKNKERSNTAMISGRKDQKTKNEILN